MTIARMTEVMAVCLTAALCVRPAAGQEEKLLFGFEPDEVAKAVQGKGVEKMPEWTVEYPRSRDLDDGTVLFFQLRNADYGDRDAATHQYHEREMAAIRPMRCVPEKASQGRYACKIVEQIDRSLAFYPSFRLPRVPAMALYQAKPQANLRLPELLNTSGWFDWAFPRDWSGYDLLRVDVLLESAEADKLILEVEDDLVEPPVSLTFQAPPPGKWATLQMDLAEAVKERRLNLKAINNVWVRLVVKDPEPRARKMQALWRAKTPETRAELQGMKFIAYVDNVRLARKGAACPTPLLQGTRSGYTALLPRSYAAEEHFIKQDPDFLAYYWPTVWPADEKMPQAKSPPTESGPVKLAAPAVVPIREMIVKGCLLDEPQNAQTHSNIRLTCTAAADPRHIIVGFDLYGTGSLRAGPTADRVVGNNASAAVATTDGGKTWKGVRGTDWPSVLGGNQSKVPPRQLDLGGNIMALSDFGCLAVRGAHVGYPADRNFFMRTVFTGDGWWMSPNYVVSGEPRLCHWVSWGDVVGAPPLFDAAKPGRIWMGWESLDRYSYEGRNTYGIFVYRSDDGGASWCGWRGPGLAGAVPPFGSRKGGVRQVRLAPYRGQVAVFAGQEWTWFDGTKWAPLEKTGAEPWQVVAFGDELYVGGSGGPTRWYDGKAWHDFALPGGQDCHGRISVCGDKTLLFTAADKSRRKLLCWRKKQGGAWQGPEQLLTEERKILQLAAARYAPPGFVAVAYMCLTREEEAKEVGGPRNKATPGNQHYCGSPPDKLIWSYPSRHWDQEPWIKVLCVPAEP